MSFTKLLGTSLQGVGKILEKIEPAAKPAVTTGFSDKEKEQIVTAIRGMSAAIDQLQQQITNLENQLETVRAMAQTVGVPPAPPPLPGSEAEWSPTGNLEKLSG